MKLVAAFFLFIALMIDFASAEQVQFNIEKVVVKCSREEACKDFQEKLQNLKQSYSTNAELKLAISPYLTENSIKSLSFMVVEEDKQHHLHVSLVLRQKIQKVSFQINREIELEGLIKSLPHIENEYYDEDKDFQAYKLIDQYLIDRGFGNNEIVMKLQKGETGDVSLTYKVNVQRVITLRDIHLVSDQDEQIKGILNRLMKFRGRSWQKLQFSLKLAEISRELFDQGYFNSKVEIVDVVENKLYDYVVANVRLFYGEKTHFYFHGLKRFTHQEVLSHLRTGLKGKYQEIKQEKLGKLIEELYESKGIFGTGVKIRKATGSNSRGQLATSYYLEIEEGKKVKIKSVNFYGINPRYEEQLNKLFFQDASDLIVSGYYDENYAEDFIAKIRLFYLERGHLFVKVTRVQTKYEDNYDSAEIAFNIDERQQVIIDKVYFSGINSKSSNTFLSSISLKEGNPINPILLDKDIELITKSLNAEGFYFARVANSGNEKILEFSQNYSSVKIHFNIEKGKESYLNEVVVSGNLLTKRDVVLRELQIRKNEILKPEDVKTFQRRLTSLGIFSFVKVSALIVNQEKSEGSHLINLLVQVKEKDHLIMEIAPGFRTDLGVKLSGSHTILNVGGMDRTLNAKAQLNRRLTLEELDSRRRGLEHMNEYSVDLNYLEPYFLPKIFDRELALSLSTQVNRKRFYGFDADIYKLSSTFSKDFTEWLGASVKYQFETIHQFEATEAQDSGNFRIGGITPAVQFDFRDDRINPRKGAFFGLSCEFANDWFGSMKNEELEINFYKMVSRNKFYYPLGKRVVLAFSASTGVQKNLARESNGSRADGTANLSGFIPSIKVFRLDGVDVVRGFSDTEINRLDDGSDISANIIDNKAFFTNFKIEPRYFVDDNMALGLFFDAGRVSVNNFKPLELKTATGMSLKFVTPVGALNFDYGIKLKRDSYKGSREGFGHFHLSIGYF
jgi:outer membrane protein insertion porin family